MISKKLTKKLKDVGFDVSIFPASSILSELIRACGDDFKCLLSPSANKMFASWFAVSEIGTIDKNGIWERWSFHGGETPEEAVANLLWSKKLNKK